MKNVIVALALSTVAFTLAGCFGPTTEEIVAADNSTCGSMGLKFACRMLLLQQREANADRLDRTPSTRSTVTATT